MTQIKTQQLSSTSVKTSADRPQTLQFGGQVFTVWSDQLINSRLDCFYWMPNVFKQQLAASNFEIKKIKDVVESIKSGTTPKQNESPFGESDYYFIRNTDLQEGYITLKKAKTIKPEIYDKYSALNLKKGDVLVCIAGTIGVSAVFDLNVKAIFNQNVSRLRFKKDILPEYANLWFNSEAFLSLIYQNATQATIKYVNNDILGNLPIPLPPLSIQNKIVDIMRKAYQEKKEKETKANKLLESIDDYVLSELGIKMPEIKREMVFEVMSDEIRDRIDSEYYQEFYKDFIDEVKRCKFSKKKLEDITEFIMNGRTPAKDDYVENEGIPLIKAGTASGKLVDLEKLGYVKKDFKGKQTVRKGDIFILSAAHQAEYVGKNVSLLDKEPAQNTYFVGELINVRANPEVCLSEYLFSFLASSFAFVLINREKRGQTSHLYPDDLKNLIIPVPPLDVQKKIVDKLKFYRTQAQNLKDEANNNLQKAKEKVERIILG